MTRNSLRAVSVGLLMSVAAPALAQAAAPVTPAVPVMRPLRDGHGGMMHGRDAFASMSEAGRATMREAMQAGGDRKTDREAVRAARDRMLAVLDADRLDNAALKRAMEDERNAANSSRERHQAAMLTAFGKLSVADRKAFVADARAMKTRMETRMKDWRGRRGPGGPGGDMPPPPPGM